MFRMALELVDADASYRQLRYYEPWLYRSENYHYQEQPRFADITPPADR